MHLISDKKPKKVIIQYSREKFVNTPLEKGLFNEK